MAMDVGAGPTAASADPTRMAGLFESVQGLRNGRALAAMLGCTVAGVLVAGLLLAMSGALGFVAPLLAALVWLVAVGTGVNAAGLLHMDTARGLSPRSLVDALVFGLACIPKLIVLAIAVLLVEIAVFLVIAILLAICKIPFLGPLLFTVVFPVSVVLAGITLFGLFLGLVLSVPAIWQGATIVRALAQTFAIVRSRLVDAVLLLLVVGFVAFAVGLVVFGVIGAGLVPVGAMSASIVDFGGFGGGLAGMASGMGGGGHAIAGGIGFMLLWAAAGSLVAQVYLLGLCLVYLRVTDGLDLTATEAALRQTLDEARRRSADLGEKARAAARPEAAVASPAVAAAPMTGDDVVASPFAAPPFAPPPADPFAEPTPAPTPFAPPSPAFVAPTPAAVVPPPAAVVPPPAAPFAAAAAAAAFAAPSATTPPADSLDADITLPPSRLAPAATDIADIDLPFDEPAAATPAGEPATPPEAPAAASCPQCLAPVTDADVFCGICGYRLK